MIMFQYFFYTRPSTSQDIVPEFPGSDWFRAEPF